MKRTLITVIWIAMLVAARGADITTTYHFSPNLLHEANPIVSVLGAGWTALLVPNILLCVFIILCTIAYWRAKPYCSIIPQAQSPWDFAAFCLYGKKMTKVEYIRRRFLSISLPPKGQRSILWQLMGFAMPPVITVGSLLAVFAWYATRAWHLPWFVHLHAHLNYALLLVPCLFVWIMMESIFFASEYRRSCSVDTAGTP